MPSAKNVLRTVEFWKVSDKKTSAVGQIIVEGEECYLVEASADEGGRVPGKVEDGAELYERFTYTERAGRLRRTDIAMVEKLSTQISGFNVALAKHAGDPLTQLDLLKEIPALSALMKDSPDDFKRLSEQLISNHTNAALNAAYLNNPEVRAEMAEAQSSPQRFSLEAYRAEILWGIPTGMVMKLSNAIGATTLASDGFIDVLFRTTEELLGAIAEKKNQNLA